MTETGINQGLARWLCAALLLPTALIFGLAGDAPHVTLLCLGAVCGSLLRRRSSAWTTRSIVYSLTLVSVVGVLGDQIVTISPDRFFILPGQLAGPIMLYLAAVILYFPLTGPTVGGVVAIALAVTAIAGNRMTAVPPLERLALIEHALPDFDLLYAVTVAVQVLVLMGLLRLIEPSRTVVGCRGGRPVRLVVLSLAMLLSVAGLGGLRWGAIAYEHWMNHLLAGFFDSYMTRRLSWFLFTDDVDLWRTVRFHGKRDRTVAVRAQATDAPGYLRGRAYNTYGTGHWRATKPKEALNSLESGGRLAFTIFRRSGAGDSPTSTTGRVAGPVEVFPAALLRTEVMLVRGGTREVTATARGISQDTNGSLLPQNWDMLAGYTFSGIDDDAYEKPFEPVITEYLDVPRVIANGLEPVLAELRRCTPPVGTAGERVARTCAFLKQRCRYELGVPFYGPIDPAVRFVTELRRGHCELFATTAVLLLRMQGIPARYVTGFVCSEPAAGGRYWIARLGDAHAWAEAFLPEEGRWVLVEATPDSGVPLLHKPEASFWRARWDALLFQWQRFFAWLKQGYLAEIIVNGLFALFAGVLWCWSTAGRAVVSSAVVLGVAACVVRFWQFRRRGKRPVVDSAARLELVAEWQRCERRLARRYGPRQPCWSVREYVVHCRSRGDSLPVSSALDTLVTRYESLRYRAAPPSPEEIQTLRRQAADLRLHL